MRATRIRPARHELEISIFITSRVKTYFHTPILAIWQMKDYKERNNFILMPDSHGKMHLKSAPQKLNFVEEKAISKD